MTGDWLAIGLAVMVVVALVPVRAEAMWQSGPIARLSLEGRYEDDRLASGGGAASIIAPTLGWRLRKPTMDLLATYGLDVYTYARSAAGGENHRIRAAEKIDLDRRTHLSLTQAAESVYDPTALTRPGVVLTGGEVQFLEGVGELSRRSTRRFRGSVGIRGEGSWFSGSGAIDGTTLAPVATAGWSLSRRDELMARYRFQLFSFTGAPVWASHEPIAGYARRFSRTSHMALEGGAAIVDGPDGRPFIDPLARMEFGLRYARAELAISADRTLVGATGLAEPLWSTSGGVHGAYRISDSLALSLGIVAFQNDRPGGPWVATGFGAAGGVEYDLGEGFAMRLAVRRVAQRGGGEIGVALSRNIYAAGLAWRFDGPPPR